MAGSDELMRFLVNTARPLIFSTAPAPPIVAGALAAVEILEASADRVDRLQNNARTLHGALASEGLAVAAAPSHILPVVIGDATTTMTICEELLEARVFAQGIRPPTVPAGTSRLRLTVSASHTTQELERAAAAIGEVARRHGLAGAGRPSMTSRDSDALAEWSIPETPGPILFDGEQDAAEVRAARAAASRRA